MLPTGDRDALGPGGDLAKGIRPVADIEVPDEKNINSPVSTASEPDDLQVHETRPHGDDVEKKADDEAIQRTTSHGSQLPMSKARTIALVITVTGAAFLNTLSAQAVVIALPTIGRDLHIPSARQQWVVSAYYLAFGCFLLLWGRLADVYGKRLIFIWGSAWVSRETCSLI